MQSNVQLEHELLGSLMQPGVDPEVVSELNKMMFTTPDTVNVFETIEALANEGSTFTMADVASWQNRTYGCGDVRCTNSNVLVNWAINMGEYSRVPMLVKALRNLYELNQLEKVLGTVYDDVNKPETIAADVRERLLTQLDQLDLGGDEEIITLGECMTELQQVISDNQSEQTCHAGYPTGLPHIDEESPLPETGLAVIAGGTSHGKSAMASQIALTAASRGDNVGIISLEMSSLSLTARAVAQHGGRNELEFPTTATGVVSADRMRRCRLDEGEVSWVNRYSRELKERGVTGRFHLVKRCDENLNAIKRLVRKMVCRRKVKLVVVDYLQLIQPDGTNKNETQEHFMARCARDLKNLGDRYGVLIIALSQLNRDVLTVRPTINRLRDSGQIAEAADWVMLLWRPEAVAPNVTFDGDWKPLPTRGLGMLIIGKNREGKLYEEVVRWVGRSTQYFEDDLYIQSLWDKINTATGASDSTDTRPVPQTTQTTLDFTALMQ